MTTTKRTLVLNMDYSPIKVICWQRAITLTYIGKEIPGEGVTPVEYYDEVVYSGSGKAFPIPAVVVTNRYIKRKKTVPIKKSTVFARDGFKCQYCGREYHPEYLTFDHVISKDEWRKKKIPGNYTNWTNIVTACSPCNRKKSNKSLAQCGMKLLSQPKEADYNTYVRGQFGKNVPEQWKVYLNIPTN
jgi:5-methylcytosine-specific restriction endonuclease McrA